MNRNRLTDANIGKTAKIRFTAEELCAFLAANYKAVLDKACCHGIPELVEDAIQEVACKILGAFGCGVNKLPCAAVANQFKIVLEEPEFKGKFATLVFAIMEGRGSARKPVEGNGKFAPFYEIFGRWE